MSTNWLVVVENKNKKKTMLIIFDWCTKKYHLAKTVMMYQLVFFRDITACERELTNNKTTKGNYHVWIFLKDVFGFAEHQENATYGSGYKLTIQRNSDNHVWIIAARADDGTNRALAWKFLTEDVSC